MNQLVISNIETEILSVTLQRQRDQINDVLDAIEKQDMSADGIKETLKTVEDKLRALRKSYLLARP
jgi:ABC-type phosphate transport system auxiliary subunit